MKFKTGLLFGTVVGFVIACVGYAQRELAQENENLIGDVDFEHLGYSKGFSDGKNFRSSYHDLNHKECDRCPH